MIARQQKTRPPKVRFPPGTFIRLSTEPGQLFEVTWVYRTREEPHIWKYALKRRTHFDTTVSKGEQRILWQPIASFSGTNNIDMWTWDTIVSTKDMLRDAEIAIDDIMGD